MKSNTRLLIPACSISAGLIASVAAFGFRDPDPLDAKATDAAITAITTKILESSQFSHRELNDKMASKFIDRYLDSLDSSHLIFLQSDIDEFSRYRPKIAEITRNQGDSSLAHLIFKRYLQRLDERTTYLAELLKNEKFDFSSDETFTYDRKDAPYPANIAAAKALWHQQLRYEYLQEKLADKKEEEIVKKLSRRTARVADTMRKLSDKAVLEMYLEALAQVYDPHSDYMGPEQMKSFEIGMNLSLIGIGATLQSQDGYCKIMELVPGGPADRSGLIKNGDRIVGVAQKHGDEYTDLVDMPLSQSVDLIRGKKGSTVYLNIIPANAADDSVRKSIQIVRDEIKLEDQQAKAQVIDLPMGDDKNQRIGVIELPSFYAGDGDGKSEPTSATADVNRLITKLKKENVTGIILDLRRNGGGSLQEAIDLTGLFISSGPVVQTRNFEGRVEIGKDNDNKVAYDGPLVVLTSRLSASASEIVAGALQDYDRALVVGDTSTFGKGTVQTLIPLARVMQGEGLIPGSDPGAIKVTISKFYRPSGKSTQLEGVKADIVIPSLTDLPEIGESDLLNPLPWDTIDSVKFTKANRVSPALDNLRQRSDQRINQAADFTELKTDIERFKKLRAEKTISLNEVTRKKEKDELKARIDANLKARLARNITPPVTYEVTLKNVNKPGLPDLFKPKKAPVIDPEDGEVNDDANVAQDLVMQEAQNILTDYCSILKSQPVAAKR